MAELSAVFASALEAERDALNARFSQRLRGGTTIDREAFLCHLRDRVAPLVDGVHDVLPERTKSVVRPLYDVSLDLFSASLLGPEAKSPWVERVWKEVLPNMIKLLARDPQQVVGCLCNAIVQIANQPGTKPQTWVDRMASVGAQCQSVSDLLQAGTVCAWQAGLVQYRKPALAATSRLPVPVAAASLGLPASSTSTELNRLLLRVQEHAWTTIEAARTNPSQPTISQVATVGAFSGFGGVLRRPPVVRAEGSQLLVSDGKSQFHLLADAFGSWFCRIGDAPSSKNPAEKCAARIDPHGTILWGTLSLSQPHLAEAASLAVNGETLAVTIPTSYHVFLYSIVGAGL